MQFHIQTDSEIPVSKQLYDRMLFAIASRQFSPGHRLPSTRQLAMQTGLHRNTIGKVYSQLEGTGLVESVPGSGIYVKSLGHQSNHLVANSQIDPRQPKDRPSSDRSCWRRLDPDSPSRRKRKLYRAEIDLSAQTRTRIGLDAS